MGILAYLKGDEKLPTVADFYPTENVENADEWLRNHEARHAISALSFNEELTMKGDVCYLTKKYVFKNGTISYPPTRLENALSLLFNN